MKQILHYILDMVYNDEAANKKDRLGREHIKYPRTGPLLVTIRNGMFHSMTIEVNFYVCFRLYKTL